MSYQSLEKSFARASILGQISAILSWDTATFMPSGASENRGVQLAYLSKQSRSIIFNGTTKKHLMAAKKDTRKLKEWQLANLRGMERAFSSYAAVPSSLERKFILASNKSEMIWREARAKSDFKIFLPALTKVISLTQDIAKYRSDYLGIDDSYEALVDIYDPGRKLADIDRIFKKLEEFLPSFIKKVQAKQEPAKPQNTLFDIEKQKELGLEVMKAFRFDFNAGRLDTSTHPFCGGHFGDIRITTRYNEKNLFSSLYGVIHETGHALYEQNKPKAWADQPVGSALGMAVHESQSLFAENQIGTSKAFIQFLQPIIVKLFELDAKTFSVDNIYSQLTHVQPSFIRVEADEATYPLHIMLRYKLEKMLISGELKAKDIPDVWNAEFEKYFGIKVPNDAAGCLQDIHWPSGGFGYFPSYTLGAVIAAQLMHRIRSEMDDIDSYLKKGDVSKIYAWLKDRIHSKGSLYATAEELLTHATSEKINPEYFIKYLENKYLQ